MSLKEIKIRMQAIEKTSTITLAMHNISLSKIPRAIQLREKTDMFMEKLQEILEYAISNLEEGNRFVNENEAKKRLYILITSDRGLAGSYHNLLFKAFLDEIKDLKKEDYMVFVLGKKGYYFATKRNLPLINKDIVYNRDDITTMHFRDYAKIIKQSFIDKDIDEVYLFNNHYVNTISQKVNKERILPIIIEKKQELQEEYIYDQPAEEILNQAINIYLESSIFRALSDAKLSEHASRMIAMKNATDNAEEIVEKLNMMYHQARQQEITNELIDVVNGSRM